MKDWQLRITETINFIKTANVPNHADKRLAIAALLDEQRNQGHITQPLSQQMSQGTLWTVIGRDAQQTLRHYRRSLILIRVILLGGNPAATSTTVNALADAILAPSLANDLNQVWQQEQVPLQNAIQALRANPANFLVNNKINIAGTNASRVFNDYAFWHRADMNRFEFLDPGNIPVFISDKVYLPVTVFHVHVQSYQAVKNNLPNITGYPAIGADVMITTQLSGCSVMYQINAGNLFATHIQPVGTNGPALCTALRANGAFAGGGLGGVAVQVFGAQAASASPNDYVMGQHTYCIGVKVGGNWQLHAQQHSAMDAHSVPTTWQIA